MVVDGVAAEVGGGEGLAAWEPTPATEMLSHQSNLARKEQLVIDLEKAGKGVEERKLLEQAKEGYSGYLNGIDWAEVAKAQLGPSVAALDDYLNLAKSVEKAHKLFNWRTNFAGSIIPEFLYRIAQARLTFLGFKPIFSTRESIVAVAASVNARNRLHFRRKDQDFCLGFGIVPLTVDGEEITLLQAALVSEVKTNIDINKLNGLEFSAERLKRSFLGARYCLVTETIDFSLRDNYASGAIDDIYVLRKQMRSKSRKVKDPLCPDVFEQWLADVEATGRRANSDRGHVYDRLERGRLING